MTKGVCARPPGVGDVAGEVLLVDEEATRVAELELAPRAYTCPVPLVVRGESLNKFGGEVLLSHSPEPGLLCRILRTPDKRR